MRHHFVVLSAMLAILVGCGASQSVAMPHSAATLRANPLVAEARAGSSYAEAMQEALDAHERDVQSAAHSWYPSYTDAWTAHQALRTPDLRAHLETALAARGRTTAQLNAFSAVHPDFVRAQNQLHRKRLAALRPDVYAVMGRIDAEHGPARPAITPAAEPMLETSTALAQADVR